jgi:hypothetical protein
MRRNLNNAPRKEYPAGVRLVHNFYPGPADDPGRDRMVGQEGFRIWVTDEPPDYPNERRCYCGWLNREHYGTLAVIGRDGLPTDAERAFGPYHKGGFEESHTTAKIGGPKRTEEELAQLASELNAVRLKKENARSGTMKAKQKRRL